MDSYRGADTSEDIKQVFARYWDGRSTSFDSRPQPVSQSDEETAAWKDILVKLTSGQKDLSILDAGTGTGFLAFLLAERNYHAGRYARPQPGGQICRYVCRDK